MQSRCITFSVYWNQKPTAVINQAQHIFHPVLLFFPDFIEQWNFREKKFFFTYQMSVCNSLQIFFYPFQISCKPTHPAKHSGKRWIIFWIQICRTDYFIQNPRNGFSFIVFVRNETVWKFIMIGMAFLTAEPANPQIFLSSASLFRIRRRESR